MKLIFSSYMDSSGLLGNDHGVEKETVVETPSKIVTLKPFSDSAPDKDTGNIKKSSVVTLDPYAVDNLETTAQIAKSNILHVEPLPLNWSFNDVYEEFSKFGLVK